MRNFFALLIITALLIISALALSACGKSDPPQSTSPDATIATPSAPDLAQTPDAAETVAQEQKLDQWSQAAMTMHQKFVAGGGSLGGGEVPPEHWDSAISTLQPMRVYVYKGHFIIVQEGGGGQEAGVVLTNPVSSEAIGMEDRDGYTFTRGDDGLVRYTRGIQTPTTATTAAPSP